MISPHVIKICVNSSKTDTIMSLEDFFGIISKVRTLSPSLKTVVLSGDSSIGWPFLNQAVGFLAEKKIDYIFTIPLSNKILTTFAYIAKSKQTVISIPTHTNIQFLCNVLSKIQAKFPPGKVKATIQISLESSTQQVLTMFSTIKNFKVPIDLSIQYTQTPIENIEQEVKKLENIINQIKLQHNRDYYYPTPLPPSFYSFIKNKKNIFNITCNNCPLFVTSFEPNGKEIRFCSKIPTSTFFKDLINYTKLQTKLIENKNNAIKAQGGKTLFFSKQIGCLQSK